MFVHIKGRLVAFILLGKLTDSPASSVLLMQNLLVVCIFPHLTKAKESQWYVNEDDSQ